MTISFADYRAVCELKAQYFRAVDTHDWDALSRVFTPDAEFSGYGFGIRAGVTSLQHTLSEVLAPVRSQHRGLSPAFLQDTPDDATPQPGLHVLWTFQDDLRWPREYRALNSPGIADQIGIRGGGYYEDTLTRTPAGWRIARSRNLRTMLEALTPSAVHQIELPSRALHERWRSS